MTVRLAITTGEPAGIGPELCLSLAQRPVAARCVLIGNHDLLQQRARDCGIRVDLTAYQAHRPAPPVGTLELDIAIDGCRDGQFDAMVTAPLHKSVICEAGTPFTGHTEYLQARCGVDQVVMLLEGGGMRVALATTHLPLREVADAITPASLERTLRILHHDLAQMYRIASPRILVAGLNPHAGEAGHLGREEIDTIIPVLERLRGEGLQLSGPLPADTLFVQHHLDEADAVLAMYHDQGLPVLKHAS
ncbi:MAG: 4-hydroxythreonine-4-phosphate dehydrogenase PdxA, partial [Betaproteobacteria bacterium]|nr:4-hydroxythreonine-4-phosphate dehydrogenase PdxA [Betaproteobacteria bacterium]